MATRLKEIDWSRPVDPVVFRRAWEAGWRGMPETILGFAAALALTKGFLTSWRALVLAVALVAMASGALWLVRRMARLDERSVRTANRVSAIVVVPAVVILVMQRGYGSALFGLVMAAGAVVLLFMRPQDTPALPKARCSACEYEAPDQIEVGGRCPECGAVWSRRGGLTYRPKELRRRVLWMQWSVVAIAVIVLAPLSQTAAKWALERMPTGVLLWWQDHAVLRGDWIWNELRGRTLSAEESRRFVDVIVALRDDNSAAFFADLWLLEQFAAGRIDGETVWRRLGGAFRPRLEVSGDVLTLTCDPIGRGMNKYHFGGAIGTVRFDGEDLGVMRNAQPWNLGRLHPDISASGRPEPMRFDLATFGPAARQSRTIEMDLWLIGWTGLAAPGPYMTPITWDADGNFVPTPPIVWTRKVVLRLEREPAGPGKQ